jgi:hypothetical protein
MNPWLFDPLGNYADHDLVGDQASGFHHGIGLFPDHGTGLDRRAQHVAGRQLRNTAPMSQCLRLRPLARTRWS